MDNHRAFRVLRVDLHTGKGQSIDFSGPETCLGGCGLAAALFEEYGLPNEPALHPDQPLIFAIGPLTGYFPLMSKTVCAFKSPYNEQYAESHAGGRMALCLRFAGYHALVVTGVAKSLSCLAFSESRLEIHNISYLKGFDVFSTGKYLRKFSKTHSGHRSTLRIGPAGENLVSYAAINVDTYRHFGRLGAGAVMGSKNLKGIIVLGGGSAPLPEGKAYPALFKEIFQDLTATDMMNKYHDLGTAENLLPLNERSALPWNNLQKTKRAEVRGISGQRFAEQLLLRKTACAGCPVGCIHVGLLREQFADKSDFLYRQVSYDFEPIFACGSMLGMTHASDVLAILDECERQGLDVMSAGVALAWATEAFEKGIVTEKDTLTPLAFDNAPGYREAMVNLGGRVNEFYRVLGQGALAAAKEYGGEDFACVLGQEMAGYATGEVFFVAQALGFRHSHLDSGGYTYDQTHEEKDAHAAARFLIDDEQKRTSLNCMVACLFSRGIYGEDRLAEALEVVGHKDAADNLSALCAEVQKHRWQLKFATGFDPDRVAIPKRFLEVTSWKGPVDADYLQSVRKAYQKSILDLSGIKS
ncbi:MAG: aldehyde ferredoxin oxidoreductase N-terminal domain-containing protein [Thermodesulfobacteriota bacterium]|nr:aldehyde ferredoxin oxidoreductase N-terminal domain-containing protein [Thermodesulfobacteriota bacterium]